MFDQETDSFNLRYLLVLLHSILNNPHFRECISKSPMIMNKIFKIVNSYEVKFPEIQHYALLILSNSSPLLSGLRISNRENLLSNFVSLLNETKGDLLTIVSPNASRSALSSP